jgi:hypothetical protein
MTPLKAGYYTPLRVEHIKGKWWRLTEPLWFFSSVADMMIKTPTGFVTDFASVPRAPLAYWLFGSRADAPAVTHDDLYRSGMLPREIADQVFLEAMKAEGYSWATRYTMYLFVRAFGRWSYKQKPGCIDFRDCPGDCTKCVNFNEDYYEMSRRR